MKNTILSYLHVRAGLPVLFALLGLNASAQKTFVRQDARFIYKLSVDVTSEYDCKVRYIAIVSKEDRREQEIVPEAENYIRCTDDSTDKQCFAVEDMNFDGYNDFRLLAGGLGNGHNLTYYYWVYKPALKKFVPDSIYDALTEPEFNGDAKAILSQSWGGSAGSGSSEYVLYKGNLRLTGEYSSAYDDYTGNYLTGRTEYIYVKGKRVMSYSEDETFDEKRKQIVTTTKKLVSGKLKVVSVIMTAAEKNK